MVLNILFSEFIKWCVQNVAAAIISISVAQVLAFLIVLMCWSKCSAPWTSHSWKVWRSSINCQRRLHILWWYFSLPRISLLKKQFPSGSIRSIRLAGVWEWSCCEICLYHWSYKSWFTAASFLIVTPKKSATLYWSSSVEESRSFTSRDVGWTCSRMGSWLPLTRWPSCGRAWFCTTSCRFWLWCWRDMMNSWLLGWAAKFEWSG